MTFLFGHDPFGRGRDTVGIKRNHVLVVVAEAHPKLGQVDLKLFRFLDGMVIQETMNCLVGRNER